MPIERITATQFADRLRTALLNRTKRYDTAYGPIPDVVINPVAAVLEDQNNNRLRRVSLLLSLLNESEFSEADLDATVYNEDILRPLGSYATTILTFRRLTQFPATEDGIIPRGFPVGTAVEQGANTVATFVTMEDKDKTYAVAVLDPNTNTTVWEVQVPATCLVRGTSGKVGSEQLTRPLRPLVGYDSVTNKESTQEGRDTYTNSELIELYLLAVTSRQLSVPTGLEFYVRDNFSGVQDVHEVFGTDPLLTRAAQDAGAVDAFVIGEDLLTRTDVVVYLGPGQKLKIAVPPAVRIDSVEKQSSGYVYEEGVDYEVALDTGGVSGSTRASDGIRFLPSSTVLPTVGDNIKITYAYNQLIRDLQADSDNDDEVRVMGRDLLYRLGTRVDIYLSAQLKALTGFRVQDIQTTVVTAILSYVNSLKLGDDVEASDLQAVVRRISGVDNFVITKLTRDPAASGTSDVPTAGNEYPRLDSINLVISSIT